MSGSTDDEWEEDTRVREARRSDRLRRLELRDAEMFGVDGDGGRFSALEGDVKAHKIEISRAHTRLDGVELFQHRIRWTVAQAVTIATVIAFVVIKAFDYLTK
jgi:hypothetical protein